MLSSTIAAISTPYGRGGISVIRISGDDAIEIADKVFKPKSGKKLNALLQGNTVYGDIVGNEGVIDDGMAAVFRAPASYTGEDTVEISCHGGILITKKVLETVFTAGAVQAGAGEFTKRAFINGKLSLSQAEAVINLIDAETEDRLKLAHSHESGVFSAKIEALYQKLLKLVSSAYVYADYPDEDLNDVTSEEMQNTLSEISRELKKLISSYKAGKAINEGIFTAIAGKPNTGKSSLLNRLLGKDRAIVSPLAGTTRDSIEETTSIGKILIRLADTAGIHSSENEIEKMGIDRSIEAINKAELILAVFDGSSALDDEDMRLISLLRDISVPKIAVINKSDSGNVIKAPEGFDKTVLLSAKTGEGFENLKDEIESLFIDGEIDYGSDAIVASARQNATLILAKKSVDDAIYTLGSGLTQDVAGLDIESALTFLSETDGRNVSAEIVDSIFHNFCVGK